MVFPVRNASRRSSGKTSFPINRYLGLNLRLTSTQIQDNESPDMQNMLLDDRQALDKRYGYEVVIDESSTGSINDLIEYKRQSGTIYLFAHSTNLHTWDPVAKTNAIIYSSLADTDISHFVWNDILYLQDGNEYIKYDGTTVETVSGTIPTVATGSPPSGGGTLFEEINLLTPGFKQQFSGDGSATAYQLVNDNLDATAVVAVVNGTTLVENTDFTVNRTNGIVTFNTAPSAGTNNVIITAYKTISGNREKITNTRFNFSYENYIFVAGNTNEPNMDYRSAINDPEYFPSNGFDELGSTASAISGYSILYSFLLIHKDDRQTFRRNSTILNDETVFQRFEHNSDIGCVSYKNIELIDNFPYVLSKKGVYAFTSIDTQNETNVQHISDNIDRSLEVITPDGLLDLGNLGDYVSVDWENKYILSNKTTGITWVYDYRYTVWYKWTNIYANVFLIINDTLYFGDSRNCKIYKFNKDLYSDDGQVINAYWRSKIFFFDTYNQYKLANRVFMTIKPNDRTSATLNIRTDRMATFEEVEVSRLSLFNYNLVNYALWTYGSGNFPKTTRNKVKQKRINELQLEILNDTLDESLGILDVTIEIIYQGEYKGR